MPPHSLIHLLCCACGVVVVEPGTLHIQVPELSGACALLCCAVLCCAGDQLSVLLELPALRSLSLADAAIRDDSLVHVGRCTKLTRLELQVGVGDAC